jgi:hypothetical protein
MDTTTMLITATAVGPALATLVAPGFTGAVAGLARSHARRVKHIEVSGAELFAGGVPMTEAQFRDLWGAYQAALDALPPVAERTDWDMAGQYSAARRMAVLAGTHPQAFPNCAGADEAWAWYAENNPYATGRAPVEPLAPSSRHLILSAAPWARLGSRGA